LAAGTSTFCCGFWIALPTSERSSIRLMTSLFGASEIASNFT
jgi:hypothetical protein